MTRPPGPARPRQHRRTVVLDADGLSKLARRDRRVRQMVRSELEQGSVVVVPPLAVIQALVEGVGRRSIYEITATTRPAPIDRERTELSATLLRQAKTNDVPDALVAAEALVAVPAIVITSDPADINRLLAGDPRSARVEVWPV